MTCPSCFKPEPQLYFKFRDVLIVFNTVNCAADIIRAYRAIQLALNHAPEMVAFNAPETEPLCPSQPAALPTQG
jgi:hypothetical protein